MKATDTMSDTPLIALNDTIRNPGNPNHMMRVRPIKADVSVHAGSVLLAKTNEALRLIEIGKDIYDPVIYVPKASLTEALLPVDELTSHCPLKGDAHYYRLDGMENPIAWIYDRALPFAAILQDHAAFYGQYVTIIERGREAL